MYVQAMRTHPHDGVLIFPLDQSVKFIPFRLAAKLVVRPSFRRESIN